MTNDEIQKAASSRKMFDFDEYGPVRIMTFVENYFMVRRHGASPFIIHATDFEKKTGISVTGSA